MDKHVELLWNDSCLGCFTFYYLGLILGNRLISPKYILRTLVILYCDSLLLQMGKDIYGSQFKLTSILSSSIFMLIMYSVIENRSHESRSGLLSTIGDHSFGIYLVHMILLKGLEPLESYSSIPYPITSVGVFTVSFVFCYVCAAVMGKRAGRWLGLI